MAGSWMEVLPPATRPCYSSSSWLLHCQKRCRRATWTQEENKHFENALAKFDADIHNRWVRVAECIPGKTVVDVVNHYMHLLDDVKEIEAGRIPCPGYASQPPFTLDWESSPTSAFDAAASRPPYCVGAKRVRADEHCVAASGHERKKGVPWTEEEHRMFLLGLKKYGKGDWRSISRNFVTTRTPTQVASHAQKYFIRLNSGGGKDKRRSSIHDITTANLPPDNKPPSPPQQFTSSARSALSSPFSMIIDSNSPADASAIINLSMNYQHVQAPFGVKLEAVACDSNSLYQI